MDYRVRAMTPADAERDRAFIAHLSDTSRYLRFMHSMREPPPALIRRLVDVDGHRNMAYVATTGEGAEESIVGVARYCAESDTGCEFAVAVADEWQCHGIGGALLRRLFEHAASEGYREIHGTILANNGAMIDLARHLGFELDSPGEGRTTLLARRRLG